MTIKELHSRLIEAYSVKNLNNLALVLINLYKNEQFSKLQKIADIIADFIVIEIDSKGKGFSKFMKLYHPDRAGFHINEINRLLSLNDFDGLLECSHILRLERIDEIANSLDSYEDIDYSPVYEWDFETEGFTITEEKDTIIDLKPKRSKKCYAFYDAIKIREYGHTDIEFPSYYLKDFDEFELASAYINDLDGVQFCIHANIIDVSDNQISDLQPLIGLKQLEELNLSDNQIGYIDVLAFLVNLKTLNLSNNLFDDVSPLFQLQKLEYVNLTGNKIDKKQIDHLIEMGITVDY